MNSFEYIFYKVIHNKYLFNKIINSIYIINNDIEYINNNKKYYVGNKLRFSIIKSLEWIIEKEQWDLLVCKLNANEYIHISNSSLNLLVERCKDIEILKLLYEKERSKLDMVDLVKLSIRHNNYEMLNVIFNNGNDTTTSTNHQSSTLTVHLDSTSVVHSGSTSSLHSDSALSLYSDSKLNSTIPQRTQLISCDDLLDSIIYSNQIQIIQLLIQHSSEYQLLELIKPLNLLERASMNMTIRDQVTEYIIDNNLMLDYSQALSLSEFSKIKNCKLKLKLLKLNAVKQPVISTSTSIINNKIFNSNYLIQVNNLNQLSIQDLLLNLKIIYKLYNLKDQIKYSIKQIERIDNQDDQKKQLIKLIIKSSYQKELYKLYILKYNELIEFNSIQNEHGYGEIIKLFSHLTFNPTGLVKTLENDYRSNTIQRNYNYIIPSDEETLLKYYQVLFNSKENLTVISNWSSGIKYLIENYSNLDLLGRILNDNNVPKKEVFDLQYLKRIKDINQFKWYINNFKNEILQVNGPINDLSIQLNDSNQSNGEGNLMVQYDIGIELIQKLNLNYYRVGYINIQKLYTSFMDLNDELRIQYLINNSSLELIVEFLNHFKDQVIKFKLFNNQSLYKLDIDCNKIKNIIILLLNNQIIKSLINLQDNSSSNNNISSYNSSSNIINNNNYNNNNSSSSSSSNNNNNYGIEILFNYLYKKLLQSYNLNLNILNLIRDELQLNNLKFIRDQDDIFNSIYYFNLRSTKISYYLTSISTYLTYQTIFYNGMLNFEVFYHGLDIQVNHLNIINQLFDVNIFNFDFIFSSKLNNHQLIELLLNTEFSNQINKIKSCQVSNSFLIIQQILHFLLIIQNQDLLFKLILEYYQLLNSKLNISSLINDILISLLEFIDANRYLTLVQFLGSCGYDLKLLVTAAILKSRVDCLTLIFNYFKNDLNIVIGSRCYSGSSLKSIEDQTCGRNGVLKSAENEFYYIVGNNHLDTLEFMLAQYPNYFKITNKMLQDSYDSGQIDIVQLLLKYKFNISNLNIIKNNNNSNNNSNNKNRIKYYIK